MNEATLVDVFVDPRRSFPLGQASAHVSSLLIKNEDLKPLSPEERKLLGEYVYEQRNKYKDQKSYTPIVVDSLSVAALVAALLRRQNKVKLSWPLIPPMNFKAVEMEVAASLNQSPSGDRFVPKEEGYYWRRERSWVSREWIMTHVYKGDEGLVFDGLWVEKIPHTRFGEWDWTPVQELPCDQREPSGDGYYWREVGGEKLLLEMKRVGDEWKMRIPPGSYFGCCRLDKFKWSVRIPNPAETPARIPSKRWVIRVGGGAAKLYPADPIYSQFVEAGPEPTGDSCHLSPPIQTGWHWLKSDDGWRPVYVGICDGRAAWQLVPWSWNYDLDEQTWGPYIYVPWVESEPLPQVTPNYPPKPGYNWFRWSKDDHWVPVYVYSTGVFYQVGSNQPIGPIANKKEFQWGGPLPSGPTA